jgi:hypothetical protein
MSNSDTTSKEDIEEQKAEFEMVITPITKKLYGDSVRARARSGRENDQRARVSVSQAIKRMTRN